MVFKNTIRLAFLTCFLCLSFVSFSQGSTVDSLTRYLAVHFDLNDTVRVDLLNRIAFLSYPDKSDDVRRYSETALRLSQRTGYKSGIANAYRNQGLYYASRNADPAALEMYERSYRLCRQIGDRQGASHSLNYMGDYYGRLRESKSQLYFYKMAYKELDVHKSSRYEGILLANTGEANENLGNFQAADQYYNLLLEMAKKIRDKELLVNAYRHLASVNYSLGNHIIALELAVKGLALVKSNTRISLRNGGEMDNLVGRIYFDLRNFAKCRAYLIASMDIARKLSNNESVCQNYYDFYHLDSSRGNYRAAISSFVRYKRMADSVQKAAADQRLAKFQIQFKIEKNNAENQRLKKEEERTRGVIAFQNISLILLISGMIIIILGLFYLQRTNKQVQLKNEIIKKQNANLEHINLVKDKLFSVVSHDLRGPILQMKGLLSLFQTGNVDDDELRQLTPRVQENLDQTLELVDNLLIWSKNQMQGFKLKPSRFELYQLAEDNIQHFCSQITSKMIVVKNELTPLDLLFADREMINIVVRNLLSNAVKFTCEGGMVRVFCLHSDEQIIVSIEDSGVGIKKENADKIFAFINYSTPGTQNEKGSGVGLKLCKDLIELNKGSIWFESKESGGSIFRFSLPAISPPATLSEAG